MPPKRQQQQQRNRSRFKVITPLRSLVLCGESDQEMEEWLKNVTESRPAVDTGTAEILSGHHQWYATSHARPTYCNVCRDALYGVTSHGLSCEICKYKVHKRCSPKAINNCKWTTLASIGKDIIENHDGTLTMPHQWMEGNLPVAAKCAICDKTCGSVLRLQDWRCLWCKVTVHTACRPSISVGCSLGPAKLSVVPPTALHSIGSDEAWEAVRPVGCSPLLVFVNSKSGDNQGIKFLRRFKQLLNPAQVFDLIKGGPGPGLRLFRHFDPFRILVCSGDGSVGWVLSEIDRLGMHKQCQVGVLPLGTGNDLARVLGWGSSCDDDTNLPHLLEKYEKAGTKMLDRWSIMTFERSISLPCHKILAEQADSVISQTMAQEYEISVMTHITNILTSEQESVVVGSAKVLYDTIKDFAVKVTEVSSSQADHHRLGDKCDAAQQKLDSLLQILQSLQKEESFGSELDQAPTTDDTTTTIETTTNADTIRSDMPSLDDEDNNKEKGQLEKPEKNLTNLNLKMLKKKRFQENQTVISRANSLKRAIRQLVEHTELALDEQSHHHPENPRLLVTTEEDTEHLKKRYLDIPEVRSDYNLADSLSVTPTPSSGEASACSSPTPNLVSLSPMPDIRRDSQGVEDFLSLPAPAEYADSRRASSTMVQENSNSNNSSMFSFDSSGVQSAVEKLAQQQQQQQQQQTPASATSPTSLDNTSSPSDDTTIQDAMMSPDSDSPMLNDSSPPESKSASDDDNNKHQHQQQNQLRQQQQQQQRQHRIVTPKSSCTNSESEIGRPGTTDSDILDSTAKPSESSEHICHIDSPENSDLANSESIVDDLSSLNQDLVSTMNSERYDSVRECLGNEQMDFNNRGQHHQQQPARRVTLARFVDGSDIGKGSIKRPNDRVDKEQVIFKCVSSKAAADRRPSYVAPGDDDNNDFDYHKLADQEEEDERGDLLNAPVCRFTVNSSPDPSNDISPNFPPAISVVVDPPSPSASVKSKFEPDLGILNHLFPHRGPDSGSMERLSVELPEGTGCSPQATRRISCGSLMKAPPELASLAASASGRFGSSLSIRHERAKSIDKTDEVKKLPIINPLVRLPMWPNVTNGFISQALLANADALCAAVSPLMDPDETLMEGYFERCVMNNYFGIGIDAKISLDFHHKREEHPEKCRSRAKNYMWYGVLGSKQWLQKTYKNLDQRVQLECDGQRIPLPSLQGIVVLNIPSFMGGTNFWGGSKEGDIFLAPSFDDRILEVVAVFGSVQMAASRLINLQHHRIAQCQSIQINILGDEGVPIQVDGEAWIQPPGIIRIIHKNRMQMLYRNRALETSLRAWEEKQRSVAAVTQSTSNLSTSSRSNSSVQFDGRQMSLSDEEMQVLLGFIEVVTTLVKWVKLLIISHPSIEADLYQVAARTAVALEKVHPDGKILQGATLRPVVTEVVSSARQLYEEACELLRDKGHNLRLREDLESKLSMSLATMEQELRKCVFDERSSGFVYLQNVPEEQSDKKNRHRGLFWLKFRRTSGRAAADPCRDQVTHWGTQEVCSWLENLQLGEYAENFISHDIRGKELLTLARRDLKELGITKVGHVKRILQSISDLNN
ncbi:diacylglycerol kinase eta isoform X2 [Trichogramma pretiosum]|uniref:diacylglycerol kinase eta isoform X2 n=1 Tax=Trichogramma pretiosum TaxID=7493 RepID=UPI0006C950C7|nr:diacylglycerol kinase eta isoform X2 [Trichogramma pretiosum]